MDAPNFLSRHRRHLLLTLGLYALLLPFAANAQDTDKDKQTGDAEATRELPAKAADKPTTEIDQSIAFSAEKIDYDSKADIVTAIGDVILNRNGYSLRADTVVWNRKTGEVTAQGQYPVDRAEWRYCLWRFDNADRYAQRRPGRKICCWC